MSLKKAWIAGVVGYSILRAVIAWGLFRDYGVNPWIFGIIDVGTAVPYASAVAELPGSIVRGTGRKIAQHLAVAVTSFMAPYAYIWIAADDAPQDLRGGLLILVLCLLIAASIGIWKKVRSESDGDGELIDVDPVDVTDGSPRTV